MASQRANYQTVIRQGGFRLTPQRKIILDILHENPGHYTPEEVYNRVQTKTTTLNRATIYRALEFFLSVGLVTVAQVKDNQTVYELADAMPHHHLVRQQCNQTEQIDHTEVATMFAEIEERFGFHINTNHLMLFGLCRECRSTEQTPARYE